ncbi:acryloyl-CoA reductase, partial [Acetobacter senegalensis]
LRGVTLVGIESVNCPNAERRAAWSALAELVDQDLLEEMTSEIPFSEVVPTAERLLAGKVRGRVVVKTP